MFLDYFALFILCLVFITIFYGVIIIHDIPYLIAKKRGHPHADAIHVAGWVSLFTLHLIWPFLWIWATIYQSERGWGMKKENCCSEDAKLTLVILDYRLQKLEEEFSLKKNIKKDC